LDEQLLFAEALTELLKKIAPKSEAVFFSKIEKTKEALQAKNYQFLLLDIAMGAQAKELIIFCKKEFTEMIIIVVSNITNVAMVKECFSLGVNGYLSKKMGSYEVKQCLEQTYTGNSYISSDLGGKIVSGYSKEKESGLTKKELELLRLIVAGNSVTKSAAQLHISPYTVLAHRRNMMAKLNLHSAAELVKYSFENDLH